MEGTRRLSLGVKLLLALDLKSGSTLVELGLGLETHGAIAPLALNVFVELSVEGLGELLQLGLVLLVDLGQAGNSGGLLVGQGAKTSLALDDGERNIHLSAEGRKPENKLDGVNIVGDEDELGLLLLNERCDVLEAELEGGRRSSGGGSGLVGDGGGSLLNSLELSLLGLRLVLDQELEQLSSLVLVQSTVELVDRRRHLQSLKEDL